MSGMKMTFSKLFVVAICFSLSVSCLAVAEASESGKNISGTAIHDMEDKELQALRLEVQHIRSDVTNITNTSNAIKQEIYQNRGILGSYGDYISLGALLLSAVALVMYMLRSNDRRERVNPNALQNHSAGLGESSCASNHKDEVGKEISKLQQQVQALKDEIGQLKGKIQNLETIQERPEKHHASDNAKMMCSAGGRAASELYDESLADEFIASYNALYDINDGMKQRLRNKELEASPSITSFTCVNHNERMIDPDMQPVFATEKDGPYMAYHLGNDYYAVIPARVTYEQTRNVAFAFREVFDSNYVDGAYNKIKVQQPAIFQGKWKLIRKGKVELSK